MQAWQAASRFTWRTAGAPLPRSHCRQRPPARANWRRGRKSPVGRGAARNEHGRQVAVRKARRSVPGRCCTTDRSHPAHSVEARDSHGRCTRHTQGGFPSLPCAAPTMSCSCCSCAAYACSGLAGGAGAPKPPRPPAPPPSMPIRAPKSRPAPGMPAAPAPPPPGRGPGPAGMSGKRPVPCSSCIACLQARGAGAGQLSLSHQGQHVTGCLRAVCPETCWAKTCSSSAPILQRARPPSSLSAPARPSSPAFSSTRPPRAPASSAALRAACVGPSWPGGAAGRTAWSASAPPAEGWRPRHCRREGARRGPASVARGHAHAGAATSVGQAGWQLLVRQRLQGQAPPLNPTLSAQHGRLGEGRGVATHLWYIGFCSNIACIWACPSGVASIADICCCISCCIAGSASIACIASCMPGSDMSCMAEGGSGQC